MATTKVTPQELRTLAGVCTKQAAAAKQIQTTVTSQIQKTDWDSPAAKKFKGDWQQHYVKALNNLQTALDELGKAAKTMATNYDEVENSYKGVKGG